MRKELAEMVKRVQDQTAWVNSAVAAVDTSLAGRRFVAGSDGGLVEAEADHRARLVDIRMSRAALTRARGPELGSQVVQAVNRARAIAEAEFRDRLRARLAG